MTYKPFTLLLVSILILLVAFPSQAKKPRSYTEVEIPEFEWNPPDYTEFELRNGMAGFVVEDDEVPLANFYIAFNAPADPSNKVGLAAMTTWVLRNGGSQNISSDSLNDLVEFKAASLYVWAGDERLSIYGGCLVDDLGLMLSLARDLINRPAYPDDKIALKRSTMLEQIRRANDRPARIARREMSQLLYPDHPWGRETTVKSVNSLTRSDLLTYHRQVFQPRGAVIGITGDVTAEQAEALAAEHFGNLPKSRYLIPALPSEVTPAATGVYYAYKDTPQAFVVVGHPSIRYEDSRRHAAEIMNYILGGSGFQSRLTKRIRVDEGLAYSTGSRLSMPVSVVGSFRASASTRPDQAGRTLTLLREVTADYKANGPTEEEFDNAKEAFINSFVWDFESSQDVLGNLVYYKWRGLPLDTPQMDLDAYQRLTLEDIREAAAELLKPEDTIIVVVGDKDKMDRPLSDFGEVHDIDLSQ